MNIIDCLSVSMREFRCFMQHPGIYIRNVHFQYQEMIAFLYIFSLILYGVIAFFAETY